MQIIMWSLWHIILNQPSLFMSAHTWNLAVTKISRTYTHWSARYPCCLHNKLCLCLQHWVDNTSVNIDCSWVIYYRVSLCLCVCGDTRAGSTNKALYSCARVRQKHLYLFANGKVYLGDELLGNEWWISLFLFFPATAAGAAGLSQAILFNWQQPPSEFISNICSPYYSNDHCQSWWIVVCIIDLKICERDSLSMHHWRNSLALWANPLGALIRIKCLSHLFSVADRNNESLNIVFQRNPSPSWPRDILRLFTLSLFPHQKNIVSDQIWKKSAKNDGHRLNKSKKKCF